MTNDVGFPVRLHSETVSCANFKTSKIFVNADLSKELQKKIIFFLRIVSHPSLSSSTFGTLCDITHAVNVVMLKVMCNE